MKAGIIESKKTISLIPGTLPYNTVAEGGAIRWTTKASMANDLNGVSAADISFFEIKGDTVFAKIEVNYTTQEYTWYSGLRSYMDYDGKCVQISGILMRSSGTILESYFPGATSVLQYNANSVFWNEARLKDLYLANVLSFGNTSGKDDSGGTYGNGSHVFRSDFISATKTRIYVHPNMMNINSGELEGDLAYAQSLGAVIIPVTSLEKPDGINDLSAGISYSTAVKLNFTVPNSLNQIRKYNVYVDGVFNSDWLDENVFVVNIPNSTTIQKVTVVAVDVFFNHSIFSNEISVTTTSQAVFPVTGLTNAFSLNETTGNMEDSQGGLTAINFGATQGVTGKIGNAIKLNGSGTYVDLGGKILGNLNKFSIAFWANTNGTAATALMGAWTGTRSFALRYATFNVFYTQWYFTDGTTQAINFLPPVGVNNRDSNFHLYVISYDGEFLTCFIDNQECTGGIALQKTIRPGTDNLRIGQSWVAPSNVVVVDEPLFYNRAISFPERTELWNNGNGIPISIN